MDISIILVQIGPMAAPLSDLMTQIAAQIRTRRITMAMTQMEAAARAGVAYRTWRRMEKDGSASIEDLIRAAIALRCEQELTALFPAPAASNMDDLLKRQQSEAAITQRQARRAVRL